jgi:dTDP-4-amino-4,6-dideoxygalactose transaminase
MSTIPVAKPMLGREEADAAAEAVLSGWVTQGPRVAAFEAAFADCVGAPHACAVSSATTALHVALLALGVGQGDEVITVSHSFIATANVVRYCGAIPVFVDVDPVTYNMDPRLIAAAVTDRTRAILCVHQIGMPCDMGEILRIAREHGLPVIEDAACAIGSMTSVDGGPLEPVGRPHGDIACFSFHPRKVITTGDGGMLTTRDPALDAKFRLLRQHGMSVTDAVRHNSAQVIFETYDEVGYNYRMTDIQAAVGIEQLKRLPGLVDERRRLAARYDAALAAIDGLGIPREPNWARTNWQTYAVRLPDRSDQRAVLQSLLDDGISARRGIMCAHREKAYADLPLRFPLPVSEAAQDHTIALPLYPGMSDADQDRVVAALKKACG